MAPAEFHKHGVRFRFPRSWKLTEEPSRNETCITVAGPRTAFWSLTLFFDCPSPDDVTETVLEAFRDEYEDLDVYPAVVRLGSKPAVGADLEFVALDLTNSAFVRVCRTDRFTAVVLYQATDDELDEGLPVLEAITDSIEFESEGDWPDFAAREGSEESEDAAVDEDDSGDIDENERWVPVE